MKNSNEKLGEKIACFFKRAFGDMKKSAKTQHEADKANFEAVKAESKATFEENRGHNTYARAKANAKMSWDDAHMSAAERAEKMQTEREDQIRDAEKRRKEADARINAAKR